MRRPVLRPEIRLHLHDPADAFDTVAAMDEKFPQKFAGHLHGVPVVEGSAQLTHPASITHPAAAQYRTDMPMNGL